MELDSCFLDNLVTVRIYFALKVGWITVKNKTWFWLARILHTSTLLFRYAYKYRGRLHHRQLEVEAPPTNHNWSQLITIDQHDISPRINMTLGTSSINRITSSCVELTRGSYGLLLFTRSMAYIGPTGSGRSFAPLFSSNTAIASCLSSSDNKISAAAYANQESRVKRQEARGKNQEPRAKSQEPRVKSPVNCKKFSCTCYARSLLYDQTDYSYRTLCGTLPLLPSWLASSFPSSARWFLPPSTR